MLYDLKKYFSLFLILLLVCTGCSCSKSEKLKEGYICGNESLINLYNKEFEETETIKRGSEVKILSKSKDGNEEYYKIKHNGKEYYVLASNISKDKDNLVTEKEMFVRTSLTVYEEMDSPKILGYLKKGSKVTIKGYDYLNDDGSVHKYKIKYDDKDGYIYGKYLLLDSDEANKPYDEENSYQNFLKIENTLGGGNAYSLDYYPYPKANFKDNTMPDEVRALYLNVSAVRNVEKYISFAKENNINAFVVDIKDNTMPGYESPVMQNYSITNYENAASTFDEYKSYIKLLKDNGFYVIGRITVFKDSFFVNDHPETAIVSTSTGEPFNHNGSYWPSAYQRPVWEFNVSLAKEAATEMGFNEIQFDYVRFPDRTGSYEKNGSISMKNTYDETKAEALQTFLMYAADELHEIGVYISADVFGECAHNYVTAYGQYWPAISNVVDVISGMPYPDHFNAYEYGFKQVVWTVPYDLLSVWGEYAAKKQTMIPTPAKVRTWIQTYNTVKSPYVVYDSNKISEQISALYEQGLSDGYMTWNAGSSLTKYEEVKEAFKKEYKK